MKRFKSPLFRKYECQQANYLNIFLHSATLDEPSAIFIQWLLFSVIRGHIGSDTFFLYFWKNKDRALVFVPMCFPYKDASTDMQHDLLGPTWDLMLTWQEVKHSPWPLINMQAFRRLSTKEIRQRSLFRPDLFVWKLFANNLFCQKGYFNLSWPLRHELLK